jgi:hypoxanthine phosphoribosyltransferase
MTGIKKVYIGPNEIHENCRQLARKIKESSTQPDLIIGLARGGLIPAGYLSYFLNINSIESIRIATYEGYESRAHEKINQIEQDLISEIINIIKKYKPQNILIVDDLTDTGSTIQIIDRIIRSVYNYFKMISERIPEFSWQFAVIYHNKNFNFNNIIWAAEKPEGWLVFPWDEEI